MQLPYCPRCTQTTQDDGGCGRQHHTIDEIDEYTRIPVDVRDTTLHVSACFTASVRPAVQQSVERVFETGLSFRCSEAQYPGKAPVPTLEAQLVPMPKVS